MPQRFYPYVRIPDEESQPILCIAVGCLNLAFWWDTEYGTYWCDFHATAEVVTSERVVCARCGFVYTPALLHEGVCIECRYEVAVKLQESR